MLISVNQCCSESKDVLQSTLADYIQLNFAQKLPQHFYFIFNSKLTYWHCMALPRMSPSISNPSISSVSKGRGSRKLFRSERSFRGPKAIGCWAWLGPMVRDCFWRGLFRRARLSWQTGYFVVVVIYNDGGGGGWGLVGVKSWRFPKYLNLLNHLL